MMRYRWLNLLIGLFCATLGWGAIPETWFEDKALLLATYEGEALPTREELFERYPRHSITIATLPEVYCTAFEKKPKSLEIEVGKAYFIDHCIHHHPDVKDEIYRQIQTILDTPDEVIIDRREGRDGVIFLKRIGEKSYVLVIRCYSDGQLVYKTLFPVGKKLYPKLPRFTLSIP